MNNKNNIEQWSSPAKLNLFLYITGQRQDGYHNLQTLFQFIDFCDYLTFTPRDDNHIKLITEFEHVEHDDNLIIKSAKLLLEYAQKHNLKFISPFGVDITIKKKLPMGGGLGGGSSNAATTLVALNQLWQLDISKVELMQIGTKIGADVPIFIFGHSAFAQGVGDDLQQVDIPEKWYFVVKPNVEIATVSIFKHPELKRDTVTRNVGALLKESFKNDCEPTVRKLYPQIDCLINLLSTKAPTRLTGTGSCIFSECETKEQAKELQLFLNMNTNESEQIKSFITKGCNHSPLFNNKI